MATLTEAGLLRVWETGLGQGPVRRALVLAVAGGADPASAAELSVGRREEFVLALRESLFGTEFCCAVTCPACAEELEVDLTIDELRVAAPHPSLRLTAGDVEVEFRLVTSRDLLAVGDGGPTARRELADPVLDALAAGLAGQDPQAGVSVALDCAGCGHEWSSPFDITAYLWGEMDAYTRRLLHEVHALALAYGWSEADVLAISPARRRFYLEMAGS